MWTETELINLFGQRNTWVKDFYVLNINKPDSPRTFKNIAKENLVNEIKINITKLKNSGVRLPADITEQLNALGIPTLSGKQWNKNTVSTFCTRNRI